MHRELLLAMLLAACVICPAAVNEDQGSSPNLKDDKPDVFMRPILYITAFVLIVILIAVVSFIYNMDEQKDPLIYSKFLTNKKKNN